jgi:DNA repair protein RadC
MSIKKEKLKLYSLMETDLFLDTSNRDYVLKIRDLPEGLKPKDKLINSGPEGLTMPELLSIIWNTGNQGEDVLEMSSRIVKEYGEKSIFAESDVNKLSKELNITIQKACQLIACGELGRRVYSNNSSGLSIITSATHFSINCDNIFGDIIYKY